MIHFGIKELSYSVKFSGNGYKYGDQKYKKLFSVSFWNNSITIKFKPSNTKIDAFDLFSVEKQSGYKCSNHFATLHAGRDYIIKLKFSKSRKIFSINVAEDRGNESYYGNVFNFPFRPLSAGFVLNKKYDYLDIERLEIED